MSRIDGRTQRTSARLEADVVVVGSGPAGCAAARELARAGASVIVVEAGRWFAPEDFQLSAFDAMSETYRDMGSSVVLGALPMPYLQGRMVGGSSPINGAICWRFPRDVHDTWMRLDPSLEETLPWALLETVTDELDARLDVRPTDPRIAGRKNELLAVGAAALGLEHRPIRRNVTACEGLGRCMQGCPSGRKRSVDTTLLADAERAGATVLSSVEVQRVLVSRGRAVGVVGLAEGGAELQLVARDGVVLAASAVQTPGLLLASGLTRGPVGEGFSGHPGVSLAGHFQEPVRNWEGATQGHEVIGLRHEGLKFEALGFDLAVLASRLHGVGRALARELDDMAHYVEWGAAVKAEASGRVRRVAGRTVVSYEPTRADIARFRRGIRVMGDMMFAAGADFVCPGVRGLPARIHDPRELARFEREGPTRPSAYMAAVTHMFGTCRMGRDPRTSVVSPRFVHHDVERLVVADSSVFPTNLGVNPQIPIMAVATLAARQLHSPT